MGANLGAGAEANGIGWEVSAMGRLRRATLSIGTAVSLLAALTVASVGAQGGFGQEPGHFTFDDVSSTASFFNPVDQSNASVSVDRSLFMFRPKAGGATTTQNETVLSVSVFVPDPVDPEGPPLVAAFGCFVIPDSDFVVSSDLQHASLNATVNESDSCPGFLVPVLGDEPAKGGGGGGGGFAFPLTVTASWTGTGLVGTSDSQGRFACGSFSSSTHVQSRSALSSAVSASISGFGAFSGPEAFGAVNVANIDMQVMGSGILPAGCGGGKGG